MLTGEDGLACPQPGDEVEGLEARIMDRVEALLERTIHRQTRALVTFMAYLAPDRLAPALGEVAVSEVFARLPLRDRGCTGLGQ